MNGFTIAYLYSSDSGAVSSYDDNRNKVSSLGLSYTGGPLYVAYAYETHRFNATINDSGDPTETGSRLGASYTIGAFKLAGQYQDLKNMGGKTATGTAVDRKTWSLAGAYNAGNNVFKAQYVNAGAISNFSSGTSGDNTGATM